MTRSRYTTGARGRVGRALGVLLVAQSLASACTGDNPLYQRSGDALDVGESDLGTPGEGGASPNTDTSIPGYGGVSGEGGFPGAGGLPGQGGIAGNGGQAGQTGNDGTGGAAPGTGGSTTMPPPTDGGTGMDTASPVDQGTPPPVDMGTPVDTGAPRPDVVTPPPDTTSPPDVVVTPPMDAAAPDAPVLQRGLSGAYHEGRNFDKKLFTRVDQMIFFPWGSGGPGGGVPTDNFSVRWTGFIQARVTGKHVFRTDNDDGVRVAIDGVPIISAWSDQTAGDNAGEYTLTAGVRVPIEVEYYERAYTATMKLYWTVPGFAEEIIPSSALSTP